MSDVMTGTRSCSTDTPSITKLSVLLVSLEIKVGIQIQYKSYVDKNYILELFEIAQIPYHIEPRKEINGHTYTTVKPLL